MTRQLSVGQQLQAIHELRLADVGREDFVDIHTWHTVACDGRSEHCDTSHFSDKVVERISAIYRDNFE